MPSALFLSPHLDDAVFSAGGTIATLADAGWQCEVATIFTRSLPNPTGFALACQTDKGLSADVDYMALRRDEDRAALAILGVAADGVLHLDLPEAPHRGYGSAAALFAGVHAEDEATTDDVQAVIAPLVEGADRVYLPFGFGRHVDHLHVIRAFSRLGRDGVQWADAPYVYREPIEVVAGWDVLAIDTVIDRKVRACEAYASQIGFQFGGVAGVGSAVRKHAAAVAAGRSAAFCEPLSGLSR